MSASIRRLATLQRPVFLVNSRSGLVTATPPSSDSCSTSPEGAPLLPKLRGHFAEFLNQGSLEHLGILSLPTCVGLRYGHRRDSLRGFSWKHGITDFTRLSLSASCLDVKGRADLPTLPAYTLEPGHPTPGPATLLRPPFGQTSRQRHGSY